MRATLHFNFVCSLIAVLGLAHAAAAAEPYKVSLKRDVEYGTGGDRKLLLDLAVPEGLTAPAPAIVCIHGGGWRAGDRGRWLNEIQLFAKQGYVAVTIQYRFAPQHRFPAQIEDCECAVRWLRAHAEELKVDPTRIGAMGDSAGGHLSLMLGTMDSSDGLEGDGGWPDQSSKVQAVVDYYGPTLFVARFPETTSNILLDFLGDPVKNKDLYRQASPLTYVSPGDAATLVFHGTKDELVPFKQATDLAAAMAEAGVPGRVELMIGQGHGWGGAEAVRTQRVAQEFFDSALKK